MTGIKKVPCPAATEAENAEQELHFDCNRNNKKSQVKIKSKLSHLLTAAKLAKKTYQAMERGARVQVNSEYTIPCYTLGCGFLDTIEGCTIWNRARSAAMIAEKAFTDLPAEIKKQLSNVPQSGEFISRAHFWQELLNPVLPDNQYHETMIAIYRWYRHIIELHKGVLQ